MILNKSIVYFIFISMIAPLSSMIKKPDRCGILMQKA